MAQLCHFAQHGLPCLGIFKVIIGRRARQHLRRRLIETAAGLAVGETAPCLTVCQFVAIFTALEKHGRIAPLKNHFKKTAPHGNQSRFGKILALKS